MTTHHYAEEGLPLLQYQTKRTSEPGENPLNSTGEFFLAPYLTPKPSGAGVFCCHKELVIGNFLGGMKEGVGIQKTGTKKLYLGEFQKDCKEGIGSAIEGADLGKILARILQPVISQYDSQAIDKYGG